MSRKEDVVLPVGFQLGGDKPGLDAKVRVRVGWTVQSLSRAQWQVWRLAHGSWSQERSGWSRSDVLTAVREREVDTGDRSAEELFDGLRMRGLLGVVRLDSPTSGFVVNHRADSLLSGIGALPEADRRGMLIGSVGRHTRVALDPAAYWLWRTAATHETLLHLHENALRTNEYDDLLRFQTDDDLLRELLGLMQFLVSRGTMWVDQRWTPRDDDAREEWE